MVEMFIATWWIGYDGKKSTNGRTPLHSSFDKGPFRTSKLLLNAGADPRVVDMICFYVLLHRKAKPLLVVGR